MTFNTDFIIKSKPKLKKIIGLRNIITDGKEWKYLIFYDVDNQSEENIVSLTNAFNSFEVSFIIYKTKHGMHAVGLTPIDIINYGIMFNDLQKVIPEYYSGQTIRLSRKEGETQELISYNLNYPYLTNLLHIYVKRFPIFKLEEPNYQYYLDWVNDGCKSNKWSLVFEKYWSYKK